MISADLENCENDYKSPEYFPFPFTPYDIQEDFMINLYEALENGKIGIFESPTGTGKSLSIICGALTWLRDLEKKKRNGSISEAESDGVNNKTKKEVDDDPSWVTEFAENLVKQKQKESQKRMLNRQEQLQNRIKAVKEKTEKKRKREEALLARNGELKPEKDEENVDLKSNISHESDDDLLADSDDESEKSNSGDESEEPHVTKIYYCSRTHSQLSQFVHEIQKTVFADNIKVVALGSRQTSCINPNVKKLKTLLKINEKCLEMQRKKKVSKSKQNSKRKKLETACQFYNHHKFNKFPDHLFTSVKDIEQAVETGENLSICPYYGSRQAIPLGQVIVLPYNTLLHKGTRQAVGIKLEGNIVIVDEAHNLIDSINDVYSSVITGTQISSSLQQLNDYLTKYRKRLKAKKIMYINQLIFVMKAFINCVQGMKTETTGLSDSNAGHTSLTTIHEFLFDIKIDNVNLFEIKKFCEDSLIARKLNGFVNRQPIVITKESADTEVNTSITSQFIHIQAFIEALTNSNEDGRVLISKHSLLANSSLKFLLLNPAVHFAEIAKECKAIIAAGGTMQPVDEIENVLLHSAGVSPDRIMQFSCGHIIPDNNLTAISLCKGPSTIDLDFSYQNRNNVALIDELGRLIRNLSTVVTGGIVCFFSSYDYEERVYQRWSSQGLLKKLDARKKVFREPRQSGNVDVLLSKYAKTIKETARDDHASCGSHQTGAILLSVVGGKMSEGINFSDELGRCIIMVGLPYPNIASPELKEKMAYFEKNIGVGAGQQHYENICMKAVNQSIGRAIRHRGDYSSILLLDKRYSKPTVISKLPSWIKNRHEVFDRFGPAFGSISKFFADKRHAVPESPL